MSEGEGLRTLNIARAFFGLRCSLLDTTGAATGHPSSREPDALMVSGAGWFGLSVRAWCARHNLSGWQVL